MNGAPAKGLLAGAIATSILAVSTAAIFIREADAPPLAIAFYRLFYATLALLPFAWWYARDDLRSLTARDWFGLSMVGAVLALHFATWITSLSYTSVASSVFLVTLHPVLVGLVSQRLYGEGPGRMGYAGIGLALVGGIVITAADSQQGGGPNPVLGDMLALAGAAAAAFYFLAGRGFRRRLGLLAYVTPVYAASAVVLGILLVVVPAPTGGAFTGYAWREHALFLGLALVPMILGHTVLNWALKYVPAPVIATTILGEPVGASVLAFVVFNELPPTLSLVGAAVVLVGISLVAVGGARAPRSVRPA